MNTPIRANWSRLRRRSLSRTLLARLSVVPTALLVMMLGALAILSLPQIGVERWLVEDAAQGSVPSVTGISRVFPMCGQGRVTCVVDGDTFWLDGIKIRIADINTPEVGAPQCAEEAALGKRAGVRLQELLNAGPFTLVAADRDEDQYGRKLRIVERNGLSLGDQLVAEGLAHPWRGYRQEWC